MPCVSCVAYADAASVERAWRALYPIACADFYRFYAGWAPQYWEKDKVGHTIVLHHYKEADGPTINGPGLVTFDPKDRKQYLMFLTRDRDGEYIAVSGQTDPDQSVEALRELAR